MTAHKECIFALLAESKRDVAAREYVSEGLYTTAVILNSDHVNVPIVLSSNILDRTKIPGISIGQGPATKRSFDQAVIDDDILSLDEMASRVVSPSCRLSERAAEGLTDFGFLKHAPILNLLNGFEYMMNNVLRSAADLVVYPQNKRPACLVDSVLLRNESSTADLAVRRARRVMALFSYALIDILKWKKVMSKRMRDRGLPPFPSMPHHAPYDYLIQLITERGTEFIGELTEEDVKPSTTAVFAVAVALAEDGVFPRISGTFYESILGYKIMSMLSVLISAEYGTLISRITRVNSAVQSNLDKRQHDYLGVAVDLEPTTPDKDVDVVIKEALHREVVKTMKEYSLTSPAAAIAKMCSIRQPFFSNFSITRVRPGKSAVRFSMYVMWNTLFLATGGLTSSIAKTNSARSHLLLSFFLKDLHALFDCTRCEYGFMIKTLDTFLMWEKEKSNAGEGDKELRKVLAAALQSLTMKIVDPQTKTVGQLVHNILAYINPGDDLNAATLAVTGKLRIRKLDGDVRELYTSNHEEYTAQGSKYVAVSKGFAALTFYLLYSSAATAPRLLNTAVTLSSKLDKAVILMLARWGNLRFPTRNMWQGGINDENSSPLLAFASIWALRNGVRARRYVHDPSNTTFVPGRPLTLLEALFSVRNLTAILNNNYVVSENIDSQKLVWKAIEELETESEIWASENRRRQNALEVMG